VFWNAGDKQTKIRAIIYVTTPYGGPCPVFVFENHVPALNLPCWYEYYIPGLGCIKEVDQWVEKVPVIHELYDIAFHDRWSCWTK